MRRGVWNVLTEYCRQRLLKACGVMWHRQQGLGDHCGTLAWLIDAAAIVNQKIMANGSYGPYCRALKRICFEESFHMKHGEDMIITLMEGTEEQRQMVQEALNRWHWIFAILRCSQVARLSPVQTEA